MGPTPTDGQLLLLTFLVWASAAGVIAVIVGFMIFGSPRHRK